MAVPRAVVKTGDLLTVTILSPLVTPMLPNPIPLTGSGTVKIMGMPICLQLDYASGIPVDFQGNTIFDYMSPPFTTPGQGMLFLTLLPVNLTTRMVNNGSPVMTSGSLIKLNFSVVVPAIQITPAGVTVNDPMVRKEGMGRITPVPPTKVFSS
ncbi:hypothetical protein OHV05_37065 (plasmid) [Kitasatospora sp. NBC_00070]|uniref:hypothetical protein n=1 Tax=Kitasatospora sp. NBC_00070 TaxID=2975962 RepID=UPI002F909B00